jgi:hypothetical protein
MLLCLSVHSLSCLSSVSSSLLFLSVSLILLLLLGKLMQKEAWPMIVLTFTFYHCLQQELLDSLFVSSSDTPMKDSNWLYLGSDLGQRFIVG